MVSNHRRGSSKGFTGGFPRAGAFQGHLAFQPPMQPSFVFTQGPPSFYNGNTAANMYAGSGNLNSQNAFIAQCPSVTATQQNYSALAAANQSATPLANYNVVADQAWYLDSATTNHVTQNTGIFLSCSAYNGAEKLHIGNGLGLLIEHVGTTVINTINSENLYLSNVLHVFVITKNLLSVSGLLTNNNAVIEFQKSVCFVMDKSTGIILLKGIARDGLYQIEGLTTVCASNKTHALLSSKSMSVINQLQNWSYVYVLSVYCI